MFLEKSGILKLGCIREIAWSLKGVVMTAQYTEEWLEFWSNDIERQVWQDYCPCCDEIAFLTTCQHCGYNITRHYARQERIEVQALVVERI